MVDRSFPQAGASEFDPYHRWLAIPPGQRPPTYYQLLGITPTETDVEVIEEAALRQTSHVRLYQTGPYAQQAARLLNELGQARATLLNAEKRRDYDARIAQGGGSSTAPTGREVDRASTPGSEEGSVLVPAIAFAVLLCLGAGLAFAVALSRSSPPAPAREVEVAP